jgi:hypothetical protein
MRKFGQTLEYPGSAVQGQVIGPIADKISSTTKFTAPVTATVTTLKQFKQEGCSRLNLHLQQANVMTTDGKLVDFTVDYGGNLCKNGSPPTEGMDIGAIAPIVELAIRLYKRLDFSQLFVRVL